MFNVITVNGDLSRKLNNDKNNLDNLFGEPIKKINSQMMT